MKKFEILHKLPKCGSETQAEQTLLENWCQSIVSAQGCLKPSIGEKHVSAKLSEPKSHKARSACYSTDFRRRIGKTTWKKCWAQWRPDIERVFNKVKKKNDYIYIYIVEFTDIWVS